MDLLNAIGIGAVSCYALLSTAYKSMQTLYARPKDHSSASEDFAFVPSVDIIVPCYNEDPHTFSECLASIANQDYAGKLRVYVVDDGSANREKLERVHHAYAGIRGSTSFCSARMSESARLRSLRYAGHLEIWCSTSTRIRH